MRRILPYLDGCGQRMRAHHPAGLPPDIHLPPLSSDRIPLDEVPQQRLFLAYSHCGGGHGVQEPHFQDAGFLVGFLSFIFLWTRYLFPHRVFVSVSTCLALGFLVLLTCLILGQTLREGPTTYHRIMEAVAAYLIVGVMCSLAYFLIEFWAPGAFNIQGPFAPEGGEALRPHFFYFSFVTLTTVGYATLCQSTRLRGRW